MENTPIIEKEITLTELAHLTYLHDHYGLHVSDNTIDRSGADIRLTKPVNITLFAGSVKRIINCKATIRIECHHTTVRLWKETPIIMVDIHSIGKEDTND